MAEDPPQSNPAPDNGPPSPSAPPPPDVAKASPPPAPASGDSPPPPPAANPDPPLSVAVDANSSSGEATGLDATMANRIIAMVIDSLVAVGLNLGIGILLFWLPDFLSKSAGLVGLAYILTRDSLPFLDGQSVGKKAMNIRAVTSDGQPLTGNWQPCLVRNVALIIPFFALVELIVLITRQDKPKPLLRLGDEWAHTKVINVDPALQSAGAGSPSSSPSPPADQGGES